jgi:hypothetical protein
MPHLIDVRRNLVTILRNRSASPLRARGNGADAPWPEIPANDAAPTRSKARRKYTDPLNYTMHSDGVGYTLLRLQFAGRVQLKGAVRIIQVIEEAAQDSREAELSAGGAND